MLGDFRDVDRGYSIALEVLTSVPELADELGMPGHLIDGLRECTHGPHDSIRSQSATRPGFAPCENGALRDPETASSP